MTIDEKLQRFTEITLAEIQKKADAELEEHKKLLKEQANAHKRTMYQNAEAEVHSEAEHVSKEINIALANEKLSLRRRYTRRQNELEDKVFDEVLDKLNSFMATSKYEDLLVRKINDAIEYAGEDNLYIYLSTNDASRLNKLIERTGFPLQVSEEAFIGGIKARIPDRNILIDESFQGAIDTLHKEFIFMGGTDV